MTKITTIGLALAKDETDTRVPVEARDALSALVALVIAVCELDRKHG